MQEVDHKRGIVIGMYLIKMLKEEQESLCGPDVGEDVRVFVARIGDTVHTYINPRILKKNTDSVLFEYTDEYGNFNLKEVTGKLMELVEKEMGKLEK